MRGAFGLGLVFLTAGAALAEPILPGIYDVAGTDLDGSSYTDVMELATDATGACTATYAGDGDNPMLGICLIDGDRLVIGSVMGGHLLGVLRQVGPGRLEGVWRIEGEAGQGHEVHTRRP
jgi:hypothetical protein